MFLLFDLSEKDLISLAWFSEESAERKEYEGQNRDLLFSVDSFLEEQGVEKGDVKGIAVVIGSGGFTSTRIATVVANTFAYVQNIPVLAVEKEEDDLKEVATRLKSQPVGQYVSAVYSAEPNITTPKG